MITIQGSDIHDALAKLKARRDDTSALEATGADKASIKFSDPVEGADGNLTPQQRLMQQMMARNQRPASTQPSGVKISSTLTAEWHLPDASPDDSLAGALELEDKIKAAIAKAGPGDTKTPEEQEVADEMAAQQNTVEGTKPDEPQFVFVHRLSDDERAKILADAFADAQSQARRMASAAGRDLGDVTQISPSNPQAENPASVYVEAMLGSTNGSASSSLDDAEISASQVNNVSQSVTLAVTFKLK